MADKKTKQCNKGYSCGFSCISTKSKCGQKLGHTAGLVAEAYVKIVQATRDPKAVDPKTWVKASNISYEHSEKTARGIPSTASAKSDDKGVVGLSLKTANQETKNKFLTSKERLQAGLLGARLIRQAIAQVPDSHVVSFSLPIKKDGLDVSRQKAWRNAGFSSAHKDGKVYGVKSGDKIYPVSPSELKAFTGS